MPEYQKITDREAALESSYIITHCKTFVQGCWFEPLLIRKDGIEKQ